MTDTDFLLADDEAMEVSPEEYNKRATNSGGFTPPLPGNYLVKPVKVEYPKKNRDGQPVLWGKPVPKYPVFALNMIEIVDPQDSARQVGVFTDVGTNLFERDGKIVSSAADLLVAVNPQAQAGSVNETITLLNSALQAQMPFIARIDYTGYDKAYVTANLPNARTKSEQDAVYKAAKIKGVYAARKSNKMHGDAAKALKPWQWIGPSKQIVELKPTVTAFYAEGTEIVGGLGPDKDFRA